MVGVIEVKDIKHEREDEVDFREGVFYKDGYCS